jgi:hypothetical protein
MLVFGGRNFFKPMFSTPIDFNTSETGKLVEDTLVSGKVQYVVDTIASASIDSNNEIYYYLVPVRSEKYIVVATSDTSTIGTFGVIYQETCEFLSGDIEDTSTSVNIDGELVSMDEDLKSMLYSWNDTTNYFTTSIDDEIIPYVIYTEDFQTLKRWGIVSIVLTIVGILGVLVSVKCIRVEE